MAALIPDVPEEFRALTNGDGLETLQVVDYVRNSLHRDCLLPFFATPSNEDHAVDSKPLFSSGDISRAATISLPSRSANNSSRSLYHDAHSHFEGATASSTKFVSGRNAALNDATNLHLTKSVTSILSGQTLRYKASMREIVTTLDEQVTRVFQCCALSFDGRFGMGKTCLVPHEKDDHLLVSTWGGV